MRNVFSPSPLVAVLLCGCGMAGALVFGQTPAASPPSQGASGTTTNDIPSSVFHALAPDDRDPFCPVGYKKPRPEDPLKPPPPPPPPEPKLTVKAIIGKSALIEGTPSELEEGQTYTYRQGEASIEYKVLKITDESVVIEYDGKQKEFKLKLLDIEKYQEKEGP